MIRWSKTLTKMIKLVLSDCVQGDSFKVKICSVSRSYIVTTINE